MDTSCYKISKMLVCYKIYGLPWTCVISGGEIKIDPTKIDAISKFPISIAMREVKIFVGVAQHLWKFIALFLVLLVVIPPILTLVMYLIWLCKWCKYASMNSYCGGQIQGPTSEHIGIYDWNIPIGLTWWLESYVNIYAWV